MCSILCVCKTDLFCVTPSPLLVAAHVDEVALKRLVHCRFWRQYLNTDALVAELGIQPYTGWAESQFFSPAGLEVTAPVLQSKPRLPTPLGAPALHFILPTFPSQVPIACSIQSTYVRWCTGTTDGGYQLDFLTKFPAVVTG